ncbi:LarC family nickel insertion protein [Brachybacterium sp. sponge]|uniref:LarC family nickel insertion protein n=1 Tax=Brachybacterium sp. sponge TaxID=1775432 RepID=UPI0007A3B437|nr:LarC family nickel insertion protein [Brachybacterium sp. sponge]
MDPATPRTAFVDATAGIAGDMLLAALVDAGADLAGVQRVLDALVPDSVRFVRSAVDRGGQRAVKVDVEVLVDDPPHRTWASIRDLLEQARGRADVPGRTIDLALAVFGRLADAEGATHGVPADEVHFHEVGALDSLADVIGACEAWRQLGIEEATGSVLAVGSGRIRAAHGDIPVPVPAVARLALGWPTVAGEILPPRGHAHSHSHDHAHDHPHSHDPVPVPDSDAALPAHAQGGPHEHGGRRVPSDVAPGIGELATPTGVALLRGLASSAGPQPIQVTEAIGVGAGTKDTPGRPNVVRVLVGRAFTAEPHAAGRPSIAPPTTAPRSTTPRATDPGSADPASDAPAASDRAPAPSTLAANELSADDLPPDAHATPTVALQLEANVDDLDPRLWPRVLEELLDAGALDAWLVPISMKHGRPAVTIHALVREGSEGPAASLLMDRTGTLGVRMHRVERIIRTREFTEIEVRGQRIAVKIARDQDGAVVRREPEFRDVAAAARVLGISERTMLDLAKEAASGLSTS